MSKKSTKNKKENSPFKIASIFLMALAGGAFLVFAILSVIFKEHFVLKMIHSNMAVTCMALLVIIISIRRFSAAKNKIRKIGWGLAVVIVFFAITLPIDNIGNLRKDRTLYEQSMLPSFTGKPTNVNYGYKGKFFRSTVHSFEIDGIEVIVKPFEFKKDTFNENLLDKTLHIKYLPHSKYAVEINDSSQLKD